MFTFGIRKIHLTDGTAIEPPKSGMTVFTGPNNTGKSVLLRELVTSVYVHPRTQEPQRWITGVDLQRDGTGADFISWLAGRGIVSRHNPRNSRHFLPNRFATSDEDGVATDAAISNWETGHLGPIGHFLVQDQWTEGRLSNQSDSRQWDWAKPPAHPSQLLWESMESLDRFSKLFEQAFGVSISINRYVPEIKLQLGSVSMPETPPPPPRELRDAFAALPYLNEQGDGMRAFANILLTSLVRPTPVIAIDEPEAFLHPPQVRLLARHLTQYAPPNCQVFVATHSADFLSGALDGSAATSGSAPRDLALVRISRTTESQTAKTLTAASVREVLDTPLLRYSNIISGVFHDGVILCEAEGDCQFYEATTDVGRGDTPHDNLIFLHVNGKSRLSDAVRKLRACGVPTAAVADLDFLNDTQLIKKALDHLGGDWSDIERDVTLVQREASSTTITTIAREIKNQINGIIQNPRGSEVLTKQQVDQITDVLKTANGWKAIKKSGVRGFEGDVYNAAHRLITYFENLGLFLVPVGELESWVPEVPRNKKAAWLTRVFAERRHLQPSADLQKFCADISGYLKAPNTFAEISTDPGITAT
ncbi:AAA family ATPase [Streptomyces sp. NPDC091280]|uniref:AAA family ATPase n=1 Tax=Streptomyces sp. NPDC091280 TaxID=3365984 RepID=UPI003801791E